MKRFVTFILFWAVMFAVAWILRMNPEKEYGWFMGLVHGGLVIPNWIISLFNSDWLYKAPLHTNAYMVFWWINVVLSILNYVVMGVVRLFVRR